MGFSLPWSLLLLSLLMGPRISREDPAPLVVTGTQGGSVTLPLYLLPEQQVESISWMSRSESRAIASVTMVEAGGLDTFYQAGSRYWGRVNVVESGYSLQISNLSQEDAGSYRAHINLRSSRITHIQEYWLQVFEKLVPPHVTLSSRIGDNGNCIIILTCVAESRGGTVVYSWTPLSPRTVISHGGSVLSVSLRPEDSFPPFTCIIKNPVSNSSSHPVSVPHICTGSGTLREVTAGNVVIGTLGKSVTLPLEVPVDQEVESVTWNSKGLIAVLQPGPAGKPVLVSEIQGPYSGRLSTPHYGYSLHISPLELWDSGPYRAGISLRSPLINITKDFTLLVYASLLACSLKKEFLLFWILGAVRIEWI
ncbi:T-lymphocyte surface antigen Ly-9-like isoform X2 [Sciurus carolinensis]|uniref:T-lymphocyte surface antigen Ly-9-like isoform X2 n=1 Tax=Sciurus carolinensis TaxID=30640 RepID=UPI001FB3C7A6|nr:T-lymphocyte surface antigen Ly-9-like isoform X2 [Sciurus carolinensis]